jgi:two-component system, OmpR family, copper resistance phosphate regulon response regulator CusR
MDTLLLVEDDRALARSLEQGLTEHGYEVVVARTLRRAQESLRESLPSLVLLDLGLPDGDGITLLRQLRNEHADLPVIITTARSELDHRLQGFEAGADDYLLKPFAFAELLARIGIQLRHARRDSVTRMELGDLVIDPLARLAQRAGRIIELTQREFDLLCYLAARSGTVISRDTLTREVWRVNTWTPSMDNVIDVHMSRLRDKVDREHDCKLLHTVRGVGFVIRPPEGGNAAAEKETFE